jgi:prepilin-type N-terminal cleavage/methylation domain-containing protein
MDRIYKMMKRNNKGFTLVELMVVLLIIGILIAIAIPIYNSTQAKAKEKACQANLRTIDGAITQYAASEDVEINSVNIENINTTYLKTWPTCPSGGNYTINNGKAECSINGHVYP